MDKSHLLRHWRFRVHRVQTGHYEAGRRYGRMHLLLGIPAIVVSTVVGTAVFASLSKDAITQKVPVVTIAVGLLSVASAVLSSLQTFMKYAELAERHKVAGTKFADLKHRIELVAAFQPLDDDQLKTQLLEIEDQWGKIREESPNTPAGVWRKIERTMTIDKDLATHPVIGRVN